MNDKIDEGVLSKQELEDLKLVRNIRMQILEENSGDNLPTGARDIEVLARVLQDTEDQAFKHAKLRASAKSDAKIDETNALLAALLLKTASPGSAPKVIEGERVDRSFLTLPSEIEDEFKDTVVPGEDRIGKPNEGLIDEIFSSGV